MVKSQRLYSRDVVSMKLWGGRFTGLTDNDVDVFNSSIKFDQKMYKADILGSIVHANMHIVCLGIKISGSGFGNIRVGLVGRGSHGTG